MPHKLPKYVRTKTAKGKTYFYFDTGQANEHGRPILKALPPLRDPGFSRAVSMLTTAREMRIDAPQLMTVSALADLYEKSQQFKGLAEASRSVYSLYLRAIRKKLGEAPACVQAPALTRSTARHSTPTSPRRCSA